MSNIKELLEKSKTIAIVGCSNDPEKASYIVASYLKSKGYKIIPVNPKYDQILGVKCYPSLKEIKENVDIVDVFRKSDDILPIAYEASNMDIKCFWMQLGIKNKEARSLLESKGIFVVENQCIKISHSNIFGGTK